MCHFLTATAGGVRDAAALEQWAGQCGLGWTRIENPTVSPHMLRDESYYWTTRSHCDCGTDVGVLSRSTPVPTVSEADVSALQKKGWSAAKIERWRSDKKSSQQRARERKLRLADEGTTAQRWVEFIQRALDQEMAEWVGMLLHWYQRSVNDENMSALTIQWVPCSQLTREFLHQTREDVLYRYRR